MSAHARCVLTGWFPKNFKCARINAQSLLDNDPATQVFISLDPVRADGGRSGYLYCEGDPVNSFDSSGLYLRKAAVSYARAWWNGFNTAKYPAYTSDCANFVSQCLFAGGISMTSDWKCRERSWVPRRTNYHFSVTSAWTQAKKQNHATIISKVDKQKGKIFFAGHSHARFNADVTKYWGRGYWKLISLKVGTK